MADAANASRPPDPRSGDAPVIDDVMMAMDVVDMLRHREDWVRRELDESGREEALIDRLRRIYSGQGIAVPDRVTPEATESSRDGRGADAFRRGIVT